MRKLRMSLFRLLRSGSEQAVASLWVVQRTVGNVSSVLVMEGSPVAAVRGKLNGIMTKRLQVARSMSW